MFTKRIFWAALTVMCAMTLNVSGQNANETPQQKFERLAKDADEHPTDWEKQIEVGHFLINKDEGMYDQTAAMKYYERIYHQAADINKAVPDSVFVETAITLMLTAMNQGDYEASMLYGNELNRYIQLINDKESTGPMMVNTMAILLLMQKGRNLEAAERLNDVRKELALREFQGVEHTDMMMATLYDQTLDDYRQFVADKLMEITIDGKPYVAIAMGAWNVEQLFMGWTIEVDGAKTLFVDEEGRVRDDLHGQMQYNFHWSDKDKAVVKSDETNTRLITVTPERRQQLIEAYRAYMQKHQ